MAHLICRRALIAGALSLCATISIPSVSFAQVGTAKNPIRIIVPYSPGGPLDVSARAIAESVKDDLGNVIVENKPGAGGNIGVSYLAHQKPDGMTLCVGAVAFVPLHSSRTCRMFWSLHRHSEIKQALRVLPI